MTKFRKGMTEMKKIYDRNDNVNTFSIYGEYGDRETDEYQTFFITLVDFPPLCQNKNTNIWI